MKGLIINTVVLIVSLNAYSQTVSLTPEPPLFRCSDEFYTENDNGLQIYKWEKNKKKVSEYIRLTCCIEGGGGIYKGYSGEGLFAGGLRHGKWKLTKCNTGVKQEINYNKGLITGYYKVFIERGTTKNGKWIKSNDSILYETNFVNGNGEWKNFYGSSRGFAISETGCYENGKKSGEWCYYTTQDWCHNYTERGVFLYRKEYYQNGLLVKEENFEIPEEYQPCLEY